MAVDAKALALEEKRMAAAKAFAEAKKIPLDQAIGELKVQIAEAQKMAEQLVLDQWAPKEV